MKKPVQKAALDVEIFGFTDAGLLLKRVYVTFDFRM